MDAFELKPTITTTFKADQPSFVRRAGDPARLIRATVNGQLLRVDGLVTHYFKREDFDLTPPQIKSLDKQAGLARKPAVPVGAATGGNASTRQPRRA